MSNLCFEIKLNWIWSFILQVIVVIEDIKMYKEKNASIFLESNIYNIDNSMLTAVIK